MKPPAPVFHPGRDADRPPPYIGADLYGELAFDEPATLRGHVPGLLVTGLAALAAAYLSDHYGAPITLMALLIGLALNFLSADRRLLPGLAFASRTLLRAGIVLLGARVTLAQVVHLGLPALVAIVLIVAMTMLIGLLVARWLGLDGPFGVLAGGAVAICGASAAMALATVLGEERAGKAQLALVLVGISAMSALAMVVYPLLAHLARLDDAQAGFLLGGSIHDVAQALGAGYSFSQTAGESASIVKLTRVALLAPAMAIVAAFFPRDRAKRRLSLGIPWFVAGFFLLAAVNSAGAVPPVVTDKAADLAGALLVCAVTATGIQSPMHSLLRSGVRPLLVIGAASVAALVLAGLAAMLVIR
jgi:uncharacterized integral membrane protein (TIGR00698 family)